MPSIPPRYSAWMLQAVESATRTADHADVPVAALVFGSDGVLLGSGRNERELRQDPTAHAEILALRAAAERTGDWHLTDTTLVVTLEPCPMCAGAILAARVPVVIFGAWDEKSGAAGSVYDLLRDRRLPHRAEVFAGVEESACVGLLLDFFQSRR